MPSAVTERSPEGAWQLVWRGTWWVLTSIPLGKEAGIHHGLQLRHPINLHKGSTLIYVFFLMAIFNNWSYVPFMYAAIHGSYGLLWLTKEVLYRDASWETPCTMGSGVFLFLGMGIGFWSSAFILISGGKEVEPRPFQLFCIAMLYIFGNWLHHSADVQKYFVLRARRGLITDGLFSRCRNPNYLGEMMIYASFALFSINSPMWWFPWVWLVLIWTGLFYPSWLAKDKSMSRYKEWNDYVAHSGLIIPWPFGDASGGKISKQG